MTIELPSALLDHDKHALIIGMTGSGKTVFSQWLVQNKAKSGHKVLYISAKLEAPDFYNKFSVSTDSVKEALKQLVNPDETHSISLTLPYMGGDILLDIFDKLEWMAK